MWIDCQQQSIESLDGTGTNKDEYIDLLFIPSVDCRRPLGVRMFGHIRAGLQNHGPLGSSMLRSIPLDAASAGP